MRLFYFKPLTMIVMLLMVIMLEGVMAKEHKKDDNSSIESYKFYNTFIPVVGVNPTYGTAYGIAFSSGITLGDIATTKMSTITANAIETTKKQTMFLVKSVGYTDNNDWMFIEDGRLFLSSQDTFGLGTGKTRDGRQQSDLLQEDGQPMDFDLYRFHFTLAKKLKPSLYLGIGYMYDQYAHIKDVSLDLENNHTTSYYDYSMKHGFKLDKAITSGVSLNLIYDTRDNVTTPYSGMYAFGSFKYFPTFLGSDKDGSSLWLEFRDYFSLSEENPRKLLALWSYYSSVTSGDLPYLDLPALGWDQFGRSGRGYTQGRFRGESIFYTELELRMPLNISKKHPDRYGYTVFANATTTSNEDRDIKLFNNFQMGAGVGFRYLLNKKSKSYLAIDLAIAENKKTSVYLNINEAF